MQRIMPLSSMWYQEKREIEGMYNDKMIYVIMRGGEEKKWAYVGSLLFNQLSQITQLRNSCIRLGERKGDFLHLI